MKKTILFLILLSIFSMLAKAEVLYKPSVGFGISYNTQNTLYNSEDNNPITYSIYTDQTFYTQNFKFGVGIGCDMSKYNGEKHCATYGWFQNHITQYALPIYLIGGYDIPVCNNHYISVELRTGIYNILSTRQNTTGGFYDGENNEFNDSYNIDIVHNLYYNPGIGIGYKFSLHNNHSIFFKLSYDYYIILKTKYDINGIYNASDNHRLSCKIGFEF